MAKRTPLYNAHMALQAKMTDFAGWDMPVYYSSIKEEHFAVRQRAGLFDIGHMGAIKVTGSSALPYLQKVLSNDASKLNNGDSQYSIILNQSGGVIDDIFVYKVNDFYILIVNASNADKDLAWLKGNLVQGVELKDLKENMTLLAFQGPMAQEILQKISNIDLGSIKHHSAKSGKINNAGSLISRTGYTGEDGFELFFDNKDAESIWGSILVAGKLNAALPCGLGARDTLRLEAGLPLYGHEYNEETSPLEAGFSFAVKFNKTENFIGKSALLKQKEDGLKRRLVGIKMLDRMIPRNGYSITFNDESIGSITSGTLSPTLDLPIAMCFIKSELSSPGQNVDIEIRGKKYLAEVIALPFYRRA